MSNRNFDNRVIIQRLQNQNYARNLFTNNVNGKHLINNPQNTDGTASNQNTFTSGGQTMYFRGLLGGGETISVGGTFGLPIKESVTTPITPIPPIPPTPSEFMVINISTTPGSLTMELPFDGITSLNINWGDGLISTYTTPPSHNYINSELYKIEIGGAASRYGNLNGYTGASLISSVSQWGTLGFSSLSGAFYNATNLVGVPDTIPSSVTDAGFMFVNTTSFNQDISGWNVSNVTNMNAMFGYAISFNQSLNNWNTSNVTNMNSMFFGALSFNSSINNWNTSNVSTMDGMFQGASSFNQSLNNWNTSNVTSMRFMFQNASNFNQSLNNWNTSSVTEVREMFNNASNFNQPLNNWNTSSILSFDNMFKNASNFNQSLNNWNTSKVTGMVSMFAGASSFNSSINNWNTSNVTDVREMFYNASSFNQDISGWSVLNVTNANYIFCDSPLSDITNELKRPNITYIGYISSCALSAPAPTQAAPAPAAPAPATTAPATTIPTPDQSAPSSTTPSSSNFMVINISTISPGQTMELPFDGITSLNINWGDGLISTYTTPPSHNYNNSGLYKIEIGGAASRYGTLERQYSGVNLISSVSQWGTLGLSSLSGAFLNAITLVEVPDTIPLSITDMSVMFAYASSFNHNISNWDVSNVTNMYAMFSGASNFNQNISNWDVSNVTTMFAMFSGTSNFNQNISKWDVSNVLDMTGMFTSAFMFNQDLSNWNVSSVSSMDSMFRETTLFNNNNQPLTWGSTSNVRNMDSMFYGALSFNQDISKWKTSGVTNMNSMFYTASLFNQDISDWTVLNVTNADYIFCNSPLSTLINASKRPVITYQGYISSCKQSAAGGLDQEQRATAPAPTPTIIPTPVPVQVPMIIQIETTPSNKIMSLPFGDFNVDVNWGDGTIESFTTGTISHEYTQNNTYTITISGTAKLFGAYGGYIGNNLITEVTQWGDLGIISLQYAFLNATQLISVPANIPNTVINTSFMFFGASNFNQDISSWNTSNVTNMSDMFNGASIFNKDISSWNTSNVTNMSYMFYQASEFNQDISSWNTLNVRNMNSMFHEATNFNNFNKSIDTWGTKLGNVLYMSNMFSQAVSFNQNISSWACFNVTNASNMLSNCPILSDSSKYPIFYKLPAGIVLSQYLA